MHAYKLRLAAAFAAAFSFGAMASQLLDQTCEVVGIADGDTFRARCPHEQITVRFAGTDAPESGQAFGQVSKQYLAQLIFKRQVRVIQTKEAMSYRRVVANVYDLNGEDIGLQMVRAGLAWHYKKFTKDQTLAEAIAYTTVENKARSEKIGLWADPYAQPPWTFRQYSRRKE